MTTRATSQDSYYHVLLTTLIQDVQAGIRMLETIDWGSEQKEARDLSALNSTLRRAVSDAKDGIRSFEDE